MLLLTIALQAFTLIEFVVRRHLSDQQISLAGLYDGNRQEGHGTRVPASGASVVTTMFERNCVSLFFDVHFRLNGKVIEAS
jgi:hypothetical protein